MASTHYLPSSLFNQRSTFSSVCHEVDHTAESCALGYLQQPGHSFNSGPSRHGRRMGQVWGLLTSVFRGTVENISCMHKHICSSCQKYHPASECPDEHHLTVRHHHRVLGTARIGAECKLGHYPVMMSYHIHCYCYWFWFLSMIYQIFNSGCMPKLLR